MKAFGTAIFLIFAILLAQFNRLTSVFRGADRGRDVDLWLLLACSSWVSLLAW